MKSIFKHSIAWAVCLLFNTAIVAQTQYDSITIGKFRNEAKFTMEPLSYTIAEALPHVSHEVTVWSVAKGFKPSAKRIKKLVAAVKSNGTEDISKCFFPRHCVNYYQGGKVISCLLICFECDGFRFANGLPATRVKSIDKREAQIKELKALFVAEGFPMLDHLPRH